jgi:hypothetical protein
MRRLSVLITVCLVAFGATVAARSATTLDGHRAVVQRHGGWMAKDANPKHPWLYVAGYSNSVVTIYDIDQLVAKKIGQITAGINGPGFLSLDSQGTLYAVQAGLVQIYAPGSTTPTLTLSQGLTDPGAAAADASGNVYVANDNGSASSILVYPPGQTTPSGAITSPLFSRPVAEVFDGAGDLYVSDWNLGVCMIPSGSQEPVSLGLQGGGQPAGIAVDAGTTDLFVNYFYGSRQYKTLVYKPGVVHPTRRLEGNLGANGIATGHVGRSTYVFVADYYSNNVYVYTSHGSQSNTVILTDAQRLNGIAFKPAGVP